MRELVARSARSKPSTAGRSEFSPTCRARSCAWVISPTIRSTLVKGAELHARRRSGAGRRRAGAVAASRIFAAVEPGHALLLDDGKVRLVATAVEDTHPHPRRGRRQTVGPQGRQPARQRQSRFPHWPRRTVPISTPRSTPASTGSRSPSSSALRTSPKQRRSARPRRRHGQDREAASGASARRDHGSRRRVDGRARRPRRRDAARESAGRPEANDAGGAARRQAGRGRDPDAGIHDREPGADPRRSVRRVDRDLRRRRRDHVVGGIRRRAISG